MKGYIINNKCYIFPQEVGQIPSIEAEIIYVQEEDIKAWKEANVGVADKIKKYNYNVMTVNPKEWSGHKDDELGPVQTPHTISKEGEAADLIEVEPQSAQEGETVTVTLVDTETYTFDLTNKAKQRIWITSDLSGEYHQEGDYYTYSMLQYDSNVYAGLYNGYKLTVKVDGQEKSTIEEFSNIFTLYDSSRAVDITDLTDVCSDNDIWIILNEEEYSFDTIIPGKTLVTAKLNGTLLEQSDSYVREFIMPSENATIEITTTAPHTITKEGEGIETISVVDQATAGETVTITLVDPGTYTFDLTNKEKQRIWIRKIVPEKEYHQEGDNYTFTMPDNDISILVGRYNGYTLTVTVDGQQASSIEDFNNILYLFDNSTWNNITDLTDVCATNNISLNLQEGYSFNAVDTGKTHVVAKLNGVELETREEPHYRQFIMPSENSTLEITTTAPQA